MWLGRLRRLLPRLRLRLRHCTVWILRRLVWVLRDVRVRLRLRLRHRTVWLRHRFMRLRHRQVRLWLRLRHRMARLLRHGRLWVRPMPLLLGLRCFRL
jgi:hypothetical protein